jgi:hypothetical protein
MGRFLSIDGCIAQSRSRASRADRTRGVSWPIKRTSLERGRALRSERKSLAQRGSGAVAGWRDSARAVQTSQTIEELRQALLALRQTGNTTWLIERHGFLTPAQFRHKQLQTAPIAA